MSDASGIEKVRRGRILVVDDNEMAARVVVRTLASEHEVTIARSGHDALARFEAGEEFELVLCDLMMPEMTGMDLFEIVTTRGLAIADRVVFMTGGAVTERTRVFLESRPVSRVLEKPFDSQRLRTLAREFVRSAPRFAKADSDADAATDSQKARAAGADRR